MPQYEYRNEFGTCPECGQDDGFLSVGRQHWFVCHKHRVKWWGGSNLFSGWREEDPGVHRENAERLKHYRKVEPREEPRDTLSSRAAAAAVVDASTNESGSGYRPLSKKAAALPAETRTLIEAARLLLQEAQDAASGIARVVDVANKRLAESGVLVDDGSLDLGARVEALASLLRTARALVRRTDPGLPF